MCFADKHECFLAVIHGLYMASITVYEECKYSGFESTRQKPNSERFHQHGSSQAIITNNLNLSLRSVENQGV